MRNLVRARALTWQRVCLAYAIAVTADAVQFMAGPLGWAGFDEAADVVAMVLLSVVLGFHPLFLPTFIVELIPVVDMLPTWTGCAVLVVALRRRQASKSPPTVHSPPVEPASPRVIDV